MKIMMYINTFHQNKLPDYPGSVHDGRGQHMHVANQCTTTKNTIITCCSKVSQLVFALITAAT